MIMHHSDDASEQCIMTLMHHDTTAKDNKEFIISQDFKIFNHNKIDLSIKVKNKKTISIVNTTYLCVLQRV